MNATVIVIVIFSSKDLCYWWKILELLHIWLSSTSYKPCDVGQNGFRLGIWKSWYDQLIGTCGRPENEDKKIDRNCFHRFNEEFAKIANFYQFFSGFTFDFTEKKSWNWNKDNLRSNVISRKKDEKLKWEAEKITQL